MRLAKLTRKRIYAAAPGSVEIRWPDGEPRIGHRYTIEHAEGRRRRVPAYIIVLAVRESRAGIYATVKIDADPIRIPAVGGGYTDFAGRALPRGDEDGPELEAVNESVQRDLTNRSAELWILHEMVAHPERITDRDLLRKRNKLRKLQAEARARGIDITPELDGAIREIQTKLSQGSAA